MASHERITSSDLPRDTGMPTVLADDQAHHIAKFVANIIQSSVEIIKQEQDLLNFLDEALEGLGDDYSEENQVTEQNRLSAEYSTMLNGEPMPDCDDGIQKDQPTPTDRPEMDTSMGADIPDLSLVNTDGSKQNISAYIQDIIREAHEKVTISEETAPLATAESSIQDDVTLTGSYYTDDSPSKESRNATQSENKQETRLSDSAVEVPASDVPSTKAVVNNNDHEKSPLSEDMDEIIEIEDDSFGQQSFVEMNSKDRGVPNKNKKKRISRIKDSILNLFSCTSSRSTNTS
ncbi:uncharacterized protein LOC117334617 isoform X2 [Pecten maximus]|uniref:uncharacterized protein LOC117334617 isoform X2 n=1 Tax=Pecten maximus TaxID=6579 RepID=UPI0014582372|nr:uncharacterized protein LOC117334617 isoform X2 [Pecten maximus]